MQIANWISAARNAIEIAGFVFLAKELMNTNTSAIVENSELQSLNIAAETISLYDGSDGETPGIQIEGGLLGKLIEKINGRQADLTASKVLIKRGLFWTGLGIAVQLVGSLGQALSS
jgi:hypothetical protein